MVGDSQESTPSRRGLIGIGAAIAGSGLIVGQAPALAAGFIDVPRSQPFAREIQWMADQGISRGWSDGTFRPYEPARRAEMAAFLYRLAGEPAFTPPAVSPFRDVTPTTTFYKEITWCQDGGILRGWNDGTFRPMVPMQRDQAVVVLYRLSGSPAVGGSAAFKDVPSSYVFRKEIAWARNVGYMLGWDDNTFRPMQPILRDAIAALFYRYSNGGAFGKGIRVQGAIAQAYWAAGGIWGRLGSPKGNERAVISGKSGARGFQQDFAGGLVLYSSRTGSRTVGGGLLTEYLGQGGATGRLGFPTGNERSFGAGWRQDFEGGFRTYYSGWNPPENRHGPVKQITSVRGGVTIRRGWNGTRVRIIQKKLGVHRTGSRQTYDLGTEDAVRAFQRRNRLTADGIVGPQTWRRLAPEYPFDMDAWRTPVAVRSNASRNERIEAMIRFCERQLGTPYTWGGAGWSNTSVAGFDCSGLLLQGLYAAGLDPQPINVVKHAEPTYRTSQQLYGDKRLASFPLEERRRGDFIFYGRTANAPVTHVTLYLGNGRMIESWSTRTSHLNYSRQPHNGYYTVKPTIKRPFV